VRNRANTSPRDEAAFINGGTAGLDNTKKSSDKSSVVSKAKPVSISFFEENLKDIDALITAEMVSGKGRVNRSDVVRAAPPSDLAEKLTHKLKEGWQPFGSPVAITPYTLMQAIAAEGDVVVSGATEPE